MLQTFHQINKINILTILSLDFFFWGGGQLPTNVFRALENFVPDKELGVGEVR